MTRALWIVTPLLILLTLAGCSPAEEPAPEPTPPPQEEPPAAAPEPTRVYFVVGFPTLRAPSSVPPGYAIAPGVSCCRAPSTTSVHP